jgi:hypothetical protein
MSAQNPFSPLNRALFCTECVMIWERVLPAVTPFLLFCGTVAVAAQWGIFNGLNGLIHLGIVAAGLSVAVSLALWQVVKFKPPSFSEINQRLAIDNDTRPEALLALRHVKTQPNLKLGKPKAGIAKGDPLALRYLLIMLSIF